MKNKSKKHFSIIGCGTAGLATAILLKREGYDVDVYEQFSNPRSIGAGLLLQPMGLWVLDKLGLAETIVSSGDKIRALVGKSRRASTILNLNYSDYTPSGFAVGVHRGNLFHALYQAALDAGIAIHCDHEVVHIETKHEQFEVFFRDRPSTSTEHLIIADGSFSRTREHVTNSFTRRDYKWGALWAILDDPDRKYSGRLSQVYHSASTMIGMLPSGVDPNTGKSCVSFFWSLTREQHQAWLDNTLDSWKEEVLSYWPDLSTSLAQIKSKEDLTFAQYSDVRFSQFNHGRCIVIGDAGHAMSPQLGQGVNMALMDAWRLKESVISNNDVALAFKYFASRRAKQLRFYQQASAVMTPFYQSHSRLLGFVRDLITPISCNIQPFKAINLAILSGNSRGFFAQGEIDKKELERLLSNYDRV